MTDRLVRDGTPDRIRERRDRPITRTVQGAEYRRLLVERATASLIAFEERGGVERLADVLEVVHALAADADVDPEAIEAARAERKQRKGGFAEGVVLEGVD